MIRKLRCRKGITLVETVVTCGLLAILAGIILAVWSPMADMSTTAKDYEDGSAIAAIVMRRIEDEVRYKYVSNTASEIRLSDGLINATTIRDEDLFGEFRVALTVDGKNANEDKSSIDITLSVVKGTESSDTHIVYEVTNTVDIQSHLNIASEPE